MRAPAAAASTAARSCAASDRTGSLISGELAAACKMAAEKAHVGAENRLHAMEFLEYAYLQIGRHEEARVIIAETKIKPQSEIVAT